LQDERTIKYLNLNIKKRSGEPLKKNKKIANKIIVVFLFIVLFIISGFITNSILIENDNNEGFDFDYQNLSSNNERIEVIANSSFYKLLPDETYYPLSWETFEVNSSCKRIEIVWNVIDNSQNRELTKDEENDLYFYIKLSKFSIIQTYNDFMKSPEKNKIVIDTTNQSLWNNWVIYFYNSLKDIEVDISYNILKVVEQ